jgi:hypothetical protein
VPRSCVAKDFEGKSRKMLDWCRVTALLVAKGLPGVPFGSLPPVPPGGPLSLSHPLQGCSGLPPCLRRCMTYNAFFHSVLAPADPSGSRPTREGAPGPVQHGTRSFRVRRGCLALHSRSRRRRRTGLLARVPEPPGQRRAATAPEQTLRRSHRHAPRPPARAEETAVHMEHARRVRQQVAELTDLRPGRILMVHADAGWYDPRLGFAAGLRAMVEPATARSARQCSFTISARRTRLPGRNPGAGVA